MKNYALFLDHKRGNVQNSKKRAAADLYFLRITAICVLLVAILLSSSCTQHLTGDLEDLRLTGIQGEQGEQGIQGIQGVQGIQGDQGDAGVQGLPGVSLGRLGGNMTKWSMPGWFHGSQSSMNSVSGVVNYFPIFVSENTTYLRTSMYPAGGSGAGKTVKMRIYEWGSDNLPGNALTDEVTFDCFTSGLKYNDTDVVLAKGYYYVGWVCNSTGVTILCPNPENCNPPIQSTGTSAVVGQNNVCLKVSAASLTNPATEPTGYNSALSAIIMFQEY